MDDKTEIWYSVKDLREMLKISRGKIYELIESHKLKAINVGSGNQRPFWRVSKKDFEDFKKRMSTIEEVVNNG